MYELLTPEQLRYKISGREEEGKSFNLILWLMVIILSVFVLLKGFVYTTVCVSGDSMLPTLQDGNYLVGNRLSAALGLYSYGDVIVVNVGEESGGCQDVTSKKIIKRVIALEGDVVDVKNGKVYVNGNLQEEDYLAENEVTERKEVSFPHTVKEGCVFVLGDNRGVSKDSRYNVYKDVKKSTVFAVIPDWEFKG